MPSWHDCYEDADGVESDQTTSTAILMPKKRIEKLASFEILALPKSQRDAMFHKLVVQAIGESFTHGSINRANTLLKLLPSVTRKMGAKEALIGYFEQWGKFVFSPASGAFMFSRDDQGRSWDDRYEARLLAASWFDSIEAPEKESRPVYDADKEFRKVLDRLLKSAEDPSTTILHSTLLSKIQDVIYAYGRSDECDWENKRGETLFDRSVKMSTTRASKFSKGA